jgi:hypothetical protein
MLLPQERGAGPIHILQNWVGDFEFLLNLLKSSLQAQLSHNYHEIKTDCF